MTGSKIVKSYFPLHIRNLKTGKNLWKRPIQGKTREDQWIKVIVSNQARRKSIQVQTKRIKHTAREVRIKENSNSKCRPHNFQAEQDLKGNSI